MTYNNSILRFNGTTGDFIDAFDVSGNSTLALVPTAGMIFGPDLNGDGIGELYASNGDGPAEVLAFDPTSGELLEKVVESGEGGLSDPKGLAFTPEGDLLVVSSATRNILRYSGRDRAAFAVTLSSPVGQTVEVDFATVDGTAISGSDYVSTSGTLTFATGTASQTVFVASTDDSSYELDETYLVMLTNALDATIADDTGVGTIIDDDPMPVNSLPVAEHDAYTVAEDGVLSLTAPGVLDGDTDADNDPLTASLVSQGSHGLVVLASDGSFVYTPNANFNGIDSFTYVANDGLANSNVATVTLTVSSVNDAPSADGQNVSTKENTTLAISLSASDIEGDSLTYSIQSGPSSGTLAGSAPNLSYTPDPGFTGNDSFTFLVNDGADNSNLATVTLTVADNLPPTADSQSVNVDEDGSLAISLTGSDPDGSLIGYVLVGSPTSGNLSGTVPNLTYTPEAEFNGLDSFTFKVNDGTDDSGVATVSIDVTPVNDPPVAFGQSLSTDEDTSAAITLAGSDIDGDALNFLIVDGPAGGSLSGTGTNRVYTPDANFNGADSFTFRANDGVADSPLVTVSLTVDAVNDAPVAQADNFAVDQDAALSVPADGVLGNDGDVDGDSLSAVPWSGSSMQGGQVVLNSDGSFSYAPPAGFTGIDSFDYSASDGGLESALATVTIDVTEANQNVIYVADIRFESERVWRWTRQTAIFEIRMDSNGDGQGGGADDVAAGVAITVEFNGNSYSGVTQSDGTFRVGVWASNASAEVVDLALADYQWNPLLDLPGDSDGDGLPDATL